MTEPRNPIVDGFASPEEAAAHAIVIQGGFSTPAREARRMLRDGGQAAAIARVWLTDHRLTVDGEDEPGPDDTAAAEALQAAMAAMVLEKAAGTIVVYDTAGPDDEPAGSETPVQIPTAEELGQIALSLAVLEDRADQAKARYAQARAAAEEMFAIARRYGTKQVGASLPDGTEFGLISIKKGASVVHADENELLFLVATTTPAELEDYVEPGALSHERVLNLLREHAPEFVKRRIRRPYRQQLQDEMTERDGWVINQKTGDLVQVATVTHYDPTGDFAYKKDRKKIAALREAVAAGQISDTGELLALPAPEGTEGGAAA